MLVVAVLGGCATFAPPLRDGPTPRFVAPQPLARDAPGVALVLSGGAARGYAHLGVIRVLEAHGLRPSIVVGSSAGSIVGVLYASGLSGAALEQAAAEFGRGTFNDVVMPRFSFLPGERGLVKGDKLHRFIDDRVAVREIERFPIRFAAVATDLSTGEVQIFNAGDPGLAVLASSAVPGVIAPAEIGGRSYADGQISSPLPVAAARRMGARKVIAVDVTYPPEDASVSSAIGVLFQSFVISAHRLKGYELADADLVITPQLPRTTGQMSFGDMATLIPAGERAAVESLERIRACFRMPVAQPERRGC